MKKFAFALDPVLGHRERIEDEKMLELAARRREVQEAQDELARLHAEYKAHSAALRDGHRDFSTDELRLHYAHLEYLDRRITAQHELVAQRQAVAERARARLVDASKDRKVIEKLKDRKYEEYVADEALAEQRDADDGNARRYARASQSASLGSPKSGGY